MIVVGEKINASRSAVKDFIESRNSQGLIDLAQKQVDAGAHFIDVNVGTGSGSRDDEIQAMEWAVKEVAPAINNPICVDSADPAVLEAGLAALNNSKALINSAKAEDDTLEEVVALAGRFNCLLVGLAMDDTGIPPTADGRIAACGKIADACSAKGVPLENVYFDPLVLPVSTDIAQGLVTLDTIKRIKAEFPGAKTIMGLSNISYGLPTRSQLNVGFLHMAAFVGLDAAIADPLDRELMAAIKTAQVLLGRDRHCRRYVKAFRN
jgi:5-methyltetrahydrofolate corrinoid/iron sulfur protein methyltransferase